MRKLEQMMSVQLRCEELREAELEMEVSICGPKQGEIMGEEDNEKDLMDYWNSSEKFEYMLTREVYESMKPCIFKSHSLCVFAGCTKYDRPFGETVTKMNKALEVKHDGEFLLEEEGIDLLQHKEFKYEFLLGVRQLAEVVMAQKHEENVVVIFQGGKQMNFFNEIDDKILKCDDT